MTEPFPPNQPGSSNKISVGFTSSSFASLFQFVGAALVLFGAYRPVNFILIGVGVAMGVLGFILRSGIRMGGTRVAFQDPITAQDKSLQIVGDEIRSANGYSVRKLEDGIQYIEAERSLTLQTKASDSPPALDQATVQEMVSQKTVGTRLHSSSVMVKVSARGSLRWDSPYENEPISQDRVVEIMQRIVEAVTLYESQSAGSNRLLP
jgi:hypothetical protein